MLAKKYRFHSRGGVRYTYQNGKSIRGSRISLVFAENQRGKQRFAVVVSKKVLKSAVGRNHIRRRVYEAIRSQLPEIKKPVDCIFNIYNREVLDMDFDKLQNLIADLLKEAEVV